MHRAAARLHAARQPEVGHHAVPLGVHQDVGRLEVAVHNLDTFNGAEVLKQNWHIAWQGADRRQPCCTNDCQEWPACLALMSWIPICTAGAISCGAARSAVHQRLA